MTTVLDERTRFTVLHLLTVKGMIVETLATRVTRLPGPDVRRALDALTEDGSAKHIPARQAWRVTTTGRDRHRELLNNDLDDEARTRLRPVYESFLPLNTRFKELCTRWQMRAGAPNDHTDPDYDQRLIAELIAELDDVHGTASRLVEQMGELRTRFTGYGERLTDALTRVRAGDLAAFTGVLTDSYHDVWMDLHRDLLLSLGMERSTRDG